MKIFIKNSKKESLKYTIGTVAIITQKWNGCLLQNQSDKVLRKK